MTTPSDTQENIVRLAVPADHMMKLKESEKGDKYVDLAREQKNYGHIWVTVIPIRIGELVKSPKYWYRDLEGLENKRMRGDLPNFGIIKIGWNIKKRPEDLR